jgi:hypothetical protein
MTPEAIRLVSNLRREFYSLFGTEMNVPIKISGSSYNSSSSIASWIDERERLNYINIYAYKAPDALLNQRPFILRIAINKGAGNITIPKQGQSCRGLNKGWNFELTLLPEEILDFLPWLVGLVKAKAKGASSFVQVPPYPVNLDTSNVLLSTVVWTQEAGRVAALQYLD